jgi:aminobenzoyl-glutamate transport protein
MPDPAALFFMALAITRVASALLSHLRFDDIDPCTGQPLVVHNQLTGPALMTFLAEMVDIYVTFPPLGVVLVTLLGAGVAEYTGFVDVSLRNPVNFVPAGLLTPVLLFASILSHTASDAGYVIVIPLGGVLFQAAGRQPLAGILCAFAGVSAGFSATFLPTSLDPLLQGLTQSSAQLIDPKIQVNPLCNIWIMSVSSLLILLVAWYITDRVAEPRIRRDATEESMRKGTRSEGRPESSQTRELKREERRGLMWALVALGLCLAALVLASLPEGSPLRDMDGKLFTSQAPLIFLFLFIPGVVYGWSAGTVKSHRDVVKGMIKMMGTFASFLMWVFFAARFHLGGNCPADGLAELSPSFVVCQVGPAGPDLCPGADAGRHFPGVNASGLSCRRLRDERRCPPMAYFPLVVGYCQRYSPGADAGWLLSRMMPYSLAIGVGWTGLLLAFWALRIPLGLE